MRSIYRIEFLPSAAAQFRKLPKRDRLRLSAIIDSLGNDPRPPGHISLKGYPGLLRIRVGAFRIVFRIEGERLTVLIVRVARRSIAYRHLPSPRP
jgi:mRNA interferase RelE/StbE